MFHKTQTKYRGAFKRIMENKRNLKSVKLMVEMLLIPFPTNQSKLIRHEGQISKKAEHFHLQGIFVLIQITQKSP